jgi:hypothetical protein
MSDPSAPRVPEGAPPRVPEGVAPRVPEGAEGAPPRVPETGLAAPARVPPPAGPELVPEVPEHESARQRQGEDPLRAEPRPDAANPAPGAAVIETGPVPFPQHPETAGVPAPRRTRGIAGWALAAAILGLAASMFVGWGFPLGIVAVAAAGMALRRPGESRQVAGWALALGILSLLYSAIWIAWAASQATLLS